MYYRYDYASELAAMSGTSTLTRTTRMQPLASPSLSVHVSGGSGSNSSMSSHHHGSGDAATLLAAAASGANIVPASSQVSCHSSVGALPVLVVGNKLDGAREATAFECMKDFGLDSVFVVSYLFNFVSLSPSTRR
jgi:hypothetical protein